MTDSIKVLCQTLYRKEGEWSNVAEYATNGSEPVDMWAMIAEGFCSINARFAGRIAIHVTGDTFDEAKSALVEELKVYESNIALLLRSAKEETR